MPGLTSIRDQVRRAAAKHDLVIVRDEFGLLEPDGLAEDREVVVYKTPLAFRRQYEPLRYSDAKVIVLAQAKDAFIPDAEARVQPDQVVSISPHSVLVAATKDASWPHTVNQFGKLVMGHLHGIVEHHKRFRERVKAGFSDSDARRVILSGVVGVDLAGEVRAEDVWSLFFLRSNVLAELEKDYPVLSGELKEAVHSMGEPVSELADGDATTTARALWTARILLQHMTGALGFLPNISTEYFSAQGWPEEAVKRLTDAVYEAEGGLAAQQIADAEKALSAEAVYLTSKKLGLSDTVKAIRIASQERLSPLLLELALRHVLSELPTKPNLLWGQSMAGLVDVARHAVAGGDTPYAGLIAVRPELHDLLRLFVDLFDVMSVAQDLAPKVRM